MVNYLQTCLKHSIYLDVVEEEEEEEEDEWTRLLYISEKTLFGLNAILCMTLGSDYQAQENRSWDQTHQIAWTFFRKNVFLYTLSHTNLSAVLVCLQGDED